MTTARLRPLLCLWAIAVLASCGAKSPALRGELPVTEPAAEPPQETVARYLADQQELESALDAELETPTASADCSAICTHRRTICDLATRICTITDRHPDDEELASRCSDARSRCERANGAAAVRCQCLDDAAPELE